MRAMIAVWALVAVVDTAAMVLGGRLAVAIASLGMMVLAVGILWGAAAQRAGWRSR